MQISKTIRKRDSPERRQRIHQVYHHATLSQWGFEVQSAEAGPKVAAIAPSTFMPRNYSTRWRWRGPTAVCCRCPKACR